MTGSASSPEPPEVAVAIVTSGLGVLVGKRRDGNPPWVFPGGKIEPGESAEDAAVREALEETGLRVRATGAIGSRVHPLTGARMVYVSAEVVDGEIGTPHAGFGDPELAELRWVGLAEAQELMGEMSRDVRQHLERTVGS